VNAHSPPTGPIDRDLQTETAGQKQQRNSSNGCLEKAANGTTTARKGQ
jgi:hypothetical protein